MLEPFETIGKIADSEGSPELGLASRLFGSAYENSFGMMNKAWTGFDSSNSQDDGMGAFLQPVDNLVAKTINEELQKNIY